MGTYANTSDITPRIGGRPLTTTSVPSTTQVSAWIDEAEAEITGVLRGLNIGSSFTGDAAEIIRGWVADYVSGKFRHASAAAGGSGTNDDGWQLIQEWRALITNIRKDPSFYAAMLFGSTTAGAASVLLSSHVTQNSQGLTADDFRPRFTTREGF